MKHAIPLCLFLCASSASAWQGWCRPPGSAPDRNAIGSLTPGHDALEASVCAIDSTPTCVEGLGSARGIQLGEHAAITAEAMRRAGLPDDAFAVVFFDYYTDGSMVPGTAVPTLQPAATGAMSQPVSRSMFIAEASELPDVSHSLSDYLLGNEHCFVPGLSSSDPAQIAACHTFAAHMGAINSTHWASLARDVYAYFHGMAGNAMDRCNALYAPLSDASFRHAERDALLESVKECEREALIIQAFAVHFIEDAWASGHMFDRWGSPLPATSEEGRLRAFVATAVVGLIHGGRLLLHDHDQVAMPGPFDLDDPHEPIVRFRDRSAFPIPGAGDTYLRSCSALHPEWSMDTINERPAGSSLQYRPVEGMLACAARGFAEIYQRGPHQLGAARAEAGSSYPFLDGALQSSTDGSCWEPRLTNEAMRLGLGGPIPGGGIDAADLADPGWFSRLQIDGIVSQVTETGVMNLRLREAFANVDAVQQDLRIEATQLAARYIVRSNKTENANLTDLASGGVPETLVRIPRSSTFVDLVRNGRIPFFEHIAPENWLESAGARCVRDSDCMQGEMCDRTYSVRNTIAIAPIAEATCVPHEVGLLRAFRDGELAYYCAHDDDEQLGLARDACRAGRSCEACRRMILPHLRNGCGRDTFQQMPNGIERRSICELIGMPAPPIVYAPYVDGDPASADRVALSICRGEIGPDPLTTIIRDPGGNMAPPVTPEIGDGPWLRSEHNVCGGTDNAWWFRFRHDPNPTAHVHPWAVGHLAFPINTLTDIHSLDVAMYRGPGCTEADRISMTPMYIDRNSDGIEDSIVLPEDVPANTGTEICIRVQAANPEQYWTHFSIATGPAWLEHL